jgi:hypothetical protein
MSASSVPVYNPNLVNSKHRTIICIVIIVGCLIAYFIYKNNNKRPDNLPSDADTLAIFKKNLQQGVYFYRKETNTLYFKSADDLKYYKVKDGSVCQALIDKAILIKDVYRIFKCSDMPQNVIPPDSCKGHPDEYSLVLYQSADDYESNLNKNLAGEVVPNVVECTGDNTPSLAPGSSSSPSSSSPSSSEAIGYASELKKLLAKGLTSIEDYLASKKEAIIAAAKQLGPIMAASIFLKHYTILLIILPQICSGDPVERAKGGIFGGFEISKLGIEKLSTYLKNLSEDTAKQSELVAKSSTKEGEVLLEKTWTNVAIDCGMVIKKASIELLETVIALCSKILSYAEGVMMIGMLLDVLDVCNLNTGYMSQEMLDSYKKSYDKAFEINMHNLGYGVADAFSADNLCDYTFNDKNNIVPLMNKSSFYEKCLSDDDRKKIAKTDYCKDEDDLFNTYVQEYFDHLSVNSLGQTVHKDISNDVIAELFKLNVGGDVDWDQLKSVTADQVKSSFSHKDNTIINLELVFTSQNILVASYIDQYFWPFLLFLIIIVFTVYFI